MSNSSSARRLRERGRALSTAHRRGGEGHNSTAKHLVFIPKEVKSGRPICDCDKPKLLIACRCCGSMCWECPREYVPPTHVVVKVIPVDDYADLQPADPVVLPATA